MTGKGGPSVNWVQIGGFLLVLATQVFTFISNQSTMKANLQALKEASEKADDAVDRDVADLIKRLREVEKDLSVLRALQKQKEGP